MKRTNLIILGAVLLPVSAIGFLGVGDSGDAFLAKITAEMISHTKQLRDMIAGIDYINELQTDARRGIDDPMNLDVKGLVDREAEIDNSILKPEGSIFTKLGSIDSIGKKVFDLFGHLENTKENQPYIQKDLQAIFSLSHAAGIAEESKGFYETGQKLLDDLDNAREGKATIRNAQAASVQIKQLSQIEANQGLQIALQAQDVLARNEQQKAMKEVSDNYLDMLDRQYEKIKEEK